MGDSVKNHSKETENVSKNDYCFTQEKCKSSIFHLYLSRKRRGMGDYYVEEDKEIIPRIQGNYYVPYCGGDYNGF